MVPDAMDDLIFASKRVQEKNGHLPVLCKLPSAQVQLDIESTNVLGEFEFDVTCLFH